MEEEIKFNLELAKDSENYSIYTKNGRKVRIICWDRDNKKQPIVALIRLPKELGFGERVATYTKTGKYYDDDEENPEDLVLIKNK